jgi:ferredoxin-NADP reductase
MTTERTVEVRVSDKAACADGIYRVTLVSASAVPLPVWEPGAHVEVDLPNGLRRQYSLSSDPSDNAAWRIGVLRESDSRGGSSYVCDTLAIGERLSLRGPRNNFPLHAAPRYLFIAGGIGITPLLPMIGSAQRAGADWALVYGGRSRSSMAFLDELSVYGDRVKVLPQDEHGLLPVERLLDGVDQDTLIYACGPESLLAALESAVAARAIITLHVERFRGAPLETEGDQPFEVHFELSGVTATVPPDRSILEVAEEHGIPVMYSCSEGTCGSCQARVLAGEVLHRDSYLTPQERGAGAQMLICVSRAAGPRLVLEL